MNTIDLYRSKKKTPKEAVELVPKKGIISMGMRAATPPALLKALEERARSGGIEDLKVYYMRCGPVALETIFQEDLMDVIHPFSTMLTRGEVELANKGFKKGKKYLQFVPMSFSYYPKMLSELIGIDTFLFTVTPMDDFGYFNFSIHGDYAIETARFAKKVIVEVNENMPRTAGDSLLHVSEVDAIVEHTCPLIEDPQRPGDELDKKIGNTIVDMIPDRATIQIGIGGVPNAVCEALKNHKDLGLHTEVLTSGTLDLIQSGTITNRYKNLHRNQNVFTFAAGDKKLYDAVHKNPSMGCYPVSHVNNPSVIAQNDNVISVNSFIEIDFSGQVNAEFMHHQFSGVGGQLDFMRGARASKGGKAILASHSTAKKGTISKITPRLQSVATDTRLDVDYVVTEYGSCRLMGLSSTERTLALISLAHPKFRDELTKQAKEMHFI
ncbi:MAG: Succinyl-CoA:coenzyme A transferase [Chlamydiae bacterium]|nr:Succinyl-CoA:coenzyme A transferase [Chlamydiota bacterium]